MKQHQNNVNEMNDIKYIQFQLISSDKLVVIELKEEELEELLFRFVVEAEEREEDLYFEIAANRPDFLQIENLVHVLRVYMRLKQKRIYKVLPAKETIFGLFVVGAILRDVTLREDSQNPQIKFIKSRNS